MCLGRRARVRPASRRLRLPWRRKRRTRERATSRALSASRRSTRLARSVRRPLSPRFSLGPGSLTDLPARPPCLPLPPVTGPLDLLRQHAVSIGAITHVAAPAAPAADDAAVDTLKTIYVGHLKDWAGKSPQDVQSAILELSHASGGTDFFHRPLAEQLDIVAGLAPHATNDDRQRVLDAFDLDARLRAVIDIMKKELYDLDVRAKIHREMKAKLDDRQKEMILGEQMRAIRKELGQDKASGKDELVDKLRAQAEGLRMPAEVGKTFEAELSKLAMLDQNASEFKCVPRPSPLLCPPSLVGSQADTHPASFAPFPRQRRPQLPRLDRLGPVGQAHGRLVFDPRLDRDPQRGPLRPDGRQGPHP